MSIEMATDTAISPSPRQDNTIYRIKGHEFVGAGLAPIGIKLSVMYSVATG